MKSATQVIQLPIEINDLGNHLLQYLARMKATSCFFGIIGIFRLEAGDGVINLLSCSSDSTRLDTRCVVGMVDCGYCPLTGSVGLMNEGA